MSTLQSIPMEHGLLLAAALFALGTAGLMLRRNLLFILMSAEIMMNATALAFVVAGARWGTVDGQVMYVLILTLQAAEACVGLALVIQLFRRFKTLDVDAAAAMRDDRWR
jgi:NADH-quinone oxidoreductase subunit K